MLGRPPCDVLELTRVAATKCIAAGIYPTIRALKSYGARGSKPRIRTALDDLAARREVVLPARKIVKPTQSTLVRGSRGPGLPVRIPRPFDPSPSPCAADVREYRAAWRRILSPLKRKATPCPDRLDPATGVAVP